MRMKRWIASALLIALAILLSSCASDRSANITNATELADAVWEFGQSHPEGFTLNIRKMTEPEEGIAVSYAATQGSHSRKQLENVVWHSLRHDGYVGGWLDKKSGLYYFDSTRLYPEDELKEAIQFGTVNGQRYVYVLSTGTSVKIGSENAAK
jgi:hypothetical protein